MYILTYMNVMYIAHANTYFLVLSIEGSLKSNTPITMRLPLTRHQKKEPRLLGRWLTLRLWQINKMGLKQKYSKTG